MTHLYLSGRDADSVAELFDGTAVDARVVSDEVGVASAVKLAYAAWTKGTAALLLAIQQFARDGFHRAAAEVFRIVSSERLREWQPGVPS